MWAVINAAGVLTGFSQSDQSSGIEVPDDCDLTPGRYRWDDAMRAFIPITAQQDSIKQEPDAIRAIYLGFSAIRDGKPLPQATLDWLDWYRNTFDNMGAA